MAAKRALRNVGGRFKEFLGIVVSAGSANDGDFVALGADGKLDTSVLPNGLGVNTVSAVASEALSSNDLVNIYNNGGVSTVRKADATTEGKEADGFVKASFASGANVTIYTPGSIMSGLTGLTPGAFQFLSTTAGLTTETAPSASGNVSMIIGKAVSTTAIIFEPDDMITIA